MSIDAGMLAVLKAWRQATQFSSDEDWVFASPARLGRQPWSYDQVWRSFLNAAAAAGIGKLGTHSMRPLMARCGGYDGCRAAKTDAPRSYDYVPTPEREAYLERHCAGRPITLPLLQSAWSACQANEKRHERGEPADRKRVQQWPR
jgi:hypothetical protein